MRSTKSPQASFPEGSLRSGSIVFSAPDLQLLGSLPSGSILGEEGTMSGQLAQQAQEILGKSALVILTERVDDVALLIGQMVKRGFVEGLDRPLPRHWKPRGGSWGWTAGMWLASILTEGDHRKVAVAVDIQGMQHPLSPLTAQGLTPLECRDDRPGHP